MRLGVAAIFKNEFDYVVEWVAWYLMAGFEKIIVADNFSSDGTTALLEALSDAGFIDIVYQPTVSSRAQIKAYARIVESYCSTLDVVLFVDADEFLTHESMQDGAEYECLSRLFSSDENIGMVGINWRTFGSSGHKKFSNFPVVERFKKCLSDSMGGVNQHLKSASRLSFVKSVDAHSAILNRGSYCHSDGSLIHDFISGDGNLTSAGGSRTKSVSTGPLRVNHYVIKSEEEYINKRKRGDAIKGPNHDRGPEYFYRHDFKDSEFEFPKEKILRLKSKISFLYKKIDLTPFGRVLKGAVGICNENLIQGWVVDEFGSSVGLSVNVFVNDLLVGSVSCGFYRDELKANNISVDGFCGFRWTHAKPLNPGDVVKVRVRSNRFNFNNFEVIVNNKLDGLFSIVQKRKSRFSIASPDDFNVKYIENHKFSFDDLRRMTPYCFNPQNNKFYFVDTNKNHTKLPFIYQAQFDSAEKVYLVDREVLGNLILRKEMKSKPIFVFSIGRCGSTLFSKLIGEMGVCDISEPDVFTAMRQQSNQPYAKNVVDLSVRSLSVFASESSGLFSIKFRSGVTNIANYFMELFPDAKFFFLTRDVEPWAKSFIQKFNANPEVLLGVLKEGYQASQNFKKRNLDFHILKYEDFSVNPSVIYKAVYGDSCIASDMLNRCNLVLQKDSQEGSGISVRKNEQQTQSLLNKFMEMFDGMNEDIKDFYK